jgi:membrane protein YqaA with SNARE-associated domain
VSDAVVVYATLFASSFLAATILPLASEPVLFATVLAGYPLWLTTVVVTVGNVLGGCTTYWLARRAAAVLERRGVADLDDSRAGRLVRRFGRPAMLLSWVPLVGDALVAVAGAVRMPFLPFLVWLAIGKAARYAVVAWSAAALR